MTLRPAVFIALPGGPGAGFDHADTYIDRAQNRLYVAHTATNAVDVIDCATNVYLRSLRDLPGVAGVLIDSERDLLITSDRAAARVSIFRCSDETLLAQVAVGARPNGLAFDPGRRRVWSFNLGEPAGVGCTASVTSLDEHSVVATIDLPGRPRWAVFDASTDTVFVNIQRPAIILALDADAGSESGRIEIGTDGPHGLALVGDRLFCAADGGELVVVDEIAGRRRVAKRLPLPGVPDVVMHDAQRHRLYVAVGSPGTVTCFDTQRLVQLERVATDEGAHTIGWDPRTARLYAFAPRRGGALVFDETD